ncbi:MAG: hemolysin III family protein [Desulfobacterales bacterium]|nr:hemolysin III family protein [Desulfobacterales bacterium]
MRRNQTLGEEIANSITHGIGAALSISGLSVLLVFASLFGDAIRIISLSVYGSSMFLLYLVSTLYHSFTNQKIKQIFRTMDHCCIYLLIAGSYTPIVLIHLKGYIGWTLFSLVWLMAILGILFEVCFTNKPKILSLLSYISMGWLVVIAAKPILATVPHGLLIWLIIGGLSYTLGVIFYTYHNLRYHHAIWHLFVLAGSICHFFGILFYIPSI